MLVCFCNEASDRIGDKYLTTTRQTHTCVYQIDIVKWLSGDCPYTVQPGRDDTRVFPIWVVMKSKFATLIWDIVTNRATKLSFLINPNRENSCVVASRLDGGGTTT